MTTKAHSLLTGSDLHEPKGIAAATSGQIYAADGAGSGTWKKLDAGNLTGIANAFSAGLLHVQEQQPNGVAGTSGNFPGDVPRTLNTVLTNEIVGSSLTANTIILPAGTYFGIASFSASPDMTLSSAASTIAKAFLRDVTHNTRLILSNNVELLFSPSGLTNFTLHSSMYLEAMGRFTLASPSTIAFFHTSSSLGLIQRPGSNGDVEVYSNVLIWRTA